MAAGAGCLLLSMGGVWDREGSPARHGRRADAAIVETLHAPSPPRTPPSDSRANRGGGGGDWHGCGAARVTPLGPRRELSEELVAVGVPGDPADGGADRGVAGGD
jgi:hypothetical protein